MPLISFASPKGGVGKTMLTANVAFELQKLGWQVVAIDFDTQNALRLHFAMPLADGRGFALDGVRGERWEDLIFETASGVLLLPFGSIGNQAAATLADFVRDNRAWLQDRIRPFLREPDVVVLVDLPPGHSVFLEEIVRFADIQLAVMLSDASSIAVLPKMETGEFFEDADGRSDAGKVRYVLNQVDLRRRLNRDVLTVLRARLRDRLLGVIYRDESIAEAIGTQRLVADFAPDSKAAYDIAVLAQRLDLLLAGEAAPLARMTGT